VTLNADDVIVGLTVYGDADLNGVANVDDYNEWAYWYNQNPPYGVAGDWQNGDFDHNGVVNVDDYNMWAYSYSNPGLLPPTDPGNTPEPGTMILLTLGAAALLRRRKSGK
jgi:hypothetical protein